MKLRLNKIEKNLIGLNLEKSDTINGHKVVKDKMLRKSSFWQLVAPNSGSQILLL
jgi:hypothetical protein